MPVVTRMNFLELIVFLQVQFPRGLKQLDHEKTIDDDYARETKNHSKDKQSKSARFHRFSGKEFFPDTFGETKIRIVKKAVVKSL